MIEIGSFLAPFEPGCVKTMTWTLVRQTELAKVEISKTRVTPRPPAVTPAPVVAPTVAIREFVTQHKLLKSLIQKAGEKKKCLPVDWIVRDSGLSAHDVDSHLRVFEMDRYTSKINNGVVCSVEAVGELMKALRSKRKMS